MVFLISGLPTLLKSPLSQATDQLQHGRSAFKKYLASLSPFFSNSSETALKSNQRCLMIILNTKVHSISHVFSLVNSKPIVSSQIIFLKDEWKIFLSLSLFHCFSFDPSSLHFALFLRAGLCLSRRCGLRWQWHVFTRSPSPSGMHCYEEDEVNKKTRQAIRGKNSVHKTQAVQLTSLMTLSVKSFV